MSDGLYFIGVKTINCSRIGLVHIFFFIYCCTVCNHYWLCESVSSLLIVTHCRAWIRTLFLYNTVLYWYNLWLKYIEPFSFVHCWSPNTCLTLNTANDFPSWLHGTLFSILETQHKPAVEPDTHSNSAGRGTRTRHFVTAACHHI